MAWTKRGNNRYFEFSVRDGDQVRRYHLGKGEAAHWAAAEIERRKLQRADAKLHRLEVKSILGEAQRTLDWCRLLQEAAILLCGYYRHDRRTTWRKRGHARSKPQEPAVTERVSELDSAQSQERAGGS